MKIKTKKEMNLAELIEWGIKNGITSKEYICNEREYKSVIFSTTGAVHLNSFQAYLADDKFEVEIEEPITALTNLDTLVEVRESGIVHTHYDASIREEECDSTVEFHALIDGKLVLIWDREKGLIE